jgi:hypothetical protein
MSLLRPEVPPPTDAWEGLREWARQSWWQRFRISLLSVIPITTLVFAFAGVALLVAETSWRSAALIGGLWVICVPLAAVGYMRRIGRSAAKVPPISAASLNPTTAVDIRGSREPE